MVSALLGMVVNRTGRADTGESPDPQISACLDWAPGPRGCPTVEQTEAAVADIVGRPVFSGPPCPITVRGKMRRLTNVWEANLSFSNSNGEILGERTLQSESVRCAALKDPVSLVIALMLEANAPQATLQVPTHESAEARRNTLSASFVVSSGLLPKLAYGGNIAWMMELLPWLSGQVGATFLAPQSTVQAGRGGEFWGVLAGVGVCPQVLTTAHLEGAICLGARTGVIHGVGVGLPYTGSPTKPYGDAEVHARVSIPLLSSLAVFVELGLAVPWLRPRFVYLDAADEPVVVHRPRAALFFAGAGVEMRSGKGAPRDEPTP